MAFTDPWYPGLLLLTALLAAAAPGAGPRAAVLLTASLIFYGWGQPWALPLLIGSALLDWAAALGMARWPRRRGLLLGLSLVGNLGLLGLFKYGDFVLASAATLGLPAPAPLGLPLPPGISFFTFQSLSYTLDVHAGRLAPRRSPFAVLGFVALFPQLVAGPIERARDLLPQLEAHRRPDRADLARAADLLAWGAVQKLVIADTLALYVDLCFAAPEAPWVVIAAGVTAFLVQILADFGGYTDLARGSALLLGVRLRGNFDRPYAATSPGDFWARWHQSFTTWMRDYVYTPLAGDGGALRRAGAAALTLTLAGLWHGAAWHFVAWGAWFAALTVGWRLLPRALRRPALGAPLTLTGVWVGMLIFRAPSLSWLVARAMHIGDPPHPQQLAAAAAVLGLGAAGGALLTAGGAALRRADGARAPIRAGAWAASMALVLIFARDTARDFVYFRF